MLYRRHILRDRIKKWLAAIVKILTVPAKKIRSGFIKIFPRRAAKYFDADLHEFKYIFMMFVYALGINIYTEVFARFTTSPVRGFVWAFEHPLVFLYNTLIIFATMTFALLFKRRRFAWFMISLIWILLGSGNGIILLSRITPLTMYDFQNFSDGLTLMTNYYPLWQIILVIVGLCVGFMAIILIFIRSDKWININYKKSIGAICLSGIVLAGATFGAVKYNVVGTFFGNLNYAFRDYGFAYGFVTTSANAGISKPRGYSEDMIGELLESKTAKGKDTKLTEKDDSKEHPNIIVLQMESFTTADSYSNIKVDKDPTPIFTDLMKNYTSGWFTVPACGAGTANTEFEVLTGISVKFFGPGEYPYKGKLRKNTVENMAYIAKSHGYATSALHNHRSLFYNRNEVYANMGFDTFTSVEYMNDVSFTPTNWCKDTVMIKDIIDIMKETKQRDFLHVISVEGHGQYPTEQVFKKPYTTVTADDEDTKWRYEYYLNECHEMDTFIGDLIDKINEANEPTIMIIYGDHIPALDVLEGNYNGPSLYNTKYVLWDNIGLKKKDKDIASYQAGAYMLAGAGLSNEGMIFDYQQNNKEDNPNYYKDLEKLSYDMLYGKYYAYGGANPYKRADMKMGHREIKIKDVIKIGDRYYIRGSNFTERSIISLKGKQLSTVYLSPTLIALNEKVDSDDVKRLEVSQVDKSEKEILSTVGANEEL